jgi:hypothetical protein
MSHYIHINDYLFTGRGVGKAWQPPQFGHKNYSLGKSKFVKKWGGIRYKNPNPSNMRRHVCENIKHDV